jgi:hypothetical protein
MTSPAQTITADLDENFSVILNSSGNGSAKISPYGTRYSGYSWQPSMLYTSVAPVPPATVIVNNASAVAYVSYGVQSATPRDAIGATQTGSTGDTCGMTQNVRPGDWITVVWTGGDAGAIATARLTGKVTIPIPTATQ